MGVCPLHQDLIANAKGSHHRLLGLDSLSFWLVAKAIETHITLALGNVYTSDICGQLVTILRAKVILIGRYKAGA